MPASLPRLNGLLKPLVADDLHNQDKLKEYLAEIIFLHKDPGTSRILSPRAVRYDDAGLKFKLSDWLHGREKRLQTLFDLAEGIRLRQQGDQATARCNVMRFDGPVVAWTFHLRVEGQAVRLEAVEVRQLCREGTFSYAAV